MTRPAAPSLWAQCDACGKAPGLPDAHGFHKCAACRTRETLTEDATAHLATLAGPAVGAWAAQWTGAGLRESDLLAALETLTASWAREEYQQQHTRAHLRRLRLAHRAPALEDLPEDAPARFAFDLEALPLIQAVQRPTLAQPWTRFLDSSGQEVGIHAGLHAALFTLPDGVRVVLYTGRDGEEEKRQGFRCPARLWEAAHAALSGPREPHTPTLTALEVEGDTVRLTVDLAGTAYTLEASSRAAYTFRPLRPEDHAGEGFRLFLRWYVLPAGQETRQAVNVPAHLWASVRASFQHLKQVRP